MRDCLSNRINMCELLCVYQIMKVYQNMCAIMVYLALTFMK